MLLEKIYKSPSTGQECTSAQYLAEVICTRFAKKKDSGDLGFKFWNKTQKKNFQATIVAVNRVIQKFDENTVVAFFMSPRGQSIFYIGYYHPQKWVLEAVGKFANHRILLESQAKIKPEAESEIEDGEAVILPVRTKKKTLFEALGSGKEEN